MRSSVRSMFPRTVVSAPSPVLVLPRQAPITPSSVWFDWGNCLTLQNGRRNRNKLWLTSNFAADSSWRGRHSHNMPGSMTLQPNRGSAVPGAIRNTSCIPSALPPLLTHCHQPCRICQPGSDKAVITLPTVQRFATEHQRVTCQEPGWNIHCIIKLVFTGSLPVSIEAVTGGQTSCKQQPWGQYRHEPNAIQLYYPDPGRRFAGWPGAGQETLSTKC